MQAANRIQRTLKEGRPAFGAWQVFPGANLSRCIARAGFDWICLDCEHGNIADAAMHDSVAAIAACGVSPLVRITGNEGWMVKRALDAGAHGIIVPLMNTAEDAKRLVDSAKFPPVGIRGFGSPFAHHCFGLPNGVEYLKQANDGLLTIVQIETQEALNNVDEIAAVPGIDVLLIGPFDLGISIGHPMLDGTPGPELRSAIEQIHQAAIRNKKFSGIVGMGGADAQQYAKKGFHMINASADMLALPVTLSAHLKQAKASL